MRYQVYGMWSKYGPGFKVGKPFNSKELAEKAVRYWQNVRAYNLMKYKIKGLR
jgi:hypothetical protein